MQMAIVEDCAEDCALLSSYIDRYFRENRPDTQYQVTCFHNAIRFLDQFHSEFDIVFLDIQMPFLNGMDAASRLRKTDPDTPLIFVTNMAQFAVKGYDVNAVGFVLKPVRYQDFYLSMRRAADLAGHREGQQFVVNNKDEMVRLSTQELLYVEVHGHVLQYHTTSRVVIGNGSLGELEKQLSRSFFLRCNNCYLVNPKYIKSVQGFQLILKNGESLQISRPRKKAFMEALNQCFSNGWA